MPRFAAHHRCLLLFLSLVALLVSSPAFAYTQKGGCEWFRGQCLLPLMPILTPEEAAQVNRPFNLAEKPIELFEYDLRTKTEIRRPLSIEELQAANTLMESEGAFKAAPKALTVVDKPWNDPVLKSIVKLVMTFGQYMAACSGTLVGKHTVLTAGHCVYGHADPSSGFNFTGYAGSITAYVEYANGDSPFAGVAAVSLACPSNWANNEDFRSDLGIIQLETDVGVPAGYQTASGNARQTTFTYAGYPGTDGYDGSDLAEGTTTPTSVNSYNVCHRNTLIQGQSGGPGWHPADDPVTIVAVNSYSSGSTNCSCRVQSWALTQINTYEGKSASPATNYWTCDFNKWDSGQACDCNCGIYDIDCKNSALPVQGCAANETCEFPGKCVCEKKCSGRHCGSDGCGGTCGTCSGSTPTCIEDTGTCIGATPNIPAKPTTSACAASASSIARWFAPGGSAPRSANASAAPAARTPPATKRPSSATPSLRKTAIRRTATPRRRTATPRRSWTAIPTAAPAPAAARLAIPPSASTPRGFAAAKSGCGW